MSHFTLMSVWLKGREAAAWTVCLIPGGKNGRRSQCLVTFSLFSLHTVQPLKSHGVNICIRIHCLGLALFCKNQLDAPGHRWGSVTGGLRSYLNFSTTC